MPVFRRRSAGAAGGTAQDPPGAHGPDRPAAAAGSRSRPRSPEAPRSPAEAAKGRPTRKRSEAERGRRQPIASSRAAAAPRTPEEKARARSERARKYEAMKRGEQWALNPRDRGPARALARDYVDCKRRLSEYYMYVLVVLLAAVFVRDKAIQTYVSPLVLVLIVIVVIDALIIRRGLRKLVAERLPGEPARGLTMYAVMRALQIRRFRMPAPRVRPGQPILPLPYRSPAAAAPPPLRGRRRPHGAASPPGAGSSGRTRPSSPPAASPGPRRRPAARASSRPASSPRRPGWRSWPRAGRSLPACRPPSRTATSRSSVPGLPRPSSP